LKKPFIILSLLLSLSIAQDYSLSFDGVDDYVEIPHSDLFNGGSAFTVEAFIKTNFSFNGEAPIVSKRPSGGWGSGYLLGSNQNVGPSNSCGFYFHGTPGGTNAASGAEWSDCSSEWLHIAGVFDGTELRTYINGILGYGIGNEGTGDLSTMVAGSYVNTQKLMLVK